MDRGIGRVQEIMSGNRRYLLHNQLRDEGRGRKEDVEVRMAYFRPWRNVVCWIFRRIHILEL